MHRWMQCAYRSTLGDLPDAWYSATSFHRRTLTIIRAHILRDAHADHPITVGWRAANAAEEARMPLKIDGYTSFDDAFKQSPELVWTVAQSLLAGRSFQERHALLNDLTLASAKAHQDDQLLVLLQMKRKLTEESVKASYARRTDFQYATERDRAAEREAEIVYRAHI